MFVVINNDLGFLLSKNFPILFPYGLYVPEIVDS